MTFSRFYPLHHYRPWDTCGLKVNFPIDMWFDLLHGVAMFSFHDTFLSEVETFLKAEGMHAATFGRKSPLRDPKFVASLRKGRSPSGRTMDVVRAWMHELRP